jgi:hypothetical protein
MGIALCTFTLLLIGWMVVRGVCLSHGVLVLSP